VRRRGRQAVALIERSVAEASQFRDIARNNPRRTDMHDSRPYCIGKPVDTRCAAMILALKRIEAHYMLEGFSQ
jgi:hypothetical protein